MSSTLEVLCSPQSEFICRTIMPVRKQDYNLVDGEWLPKNSWTIDGHPCEVETVTRRSNGCPDSIELIARVPSKNPGNIALYSVDEVPLVQSPNLSSATTFGPITIGCKVDGQSFTAVFSPSTHHKKVMRNNGLVKTTRYYDRLKNGSEELFGVHLYVTQSVADDSYEIDLRINNGTVENPLGGVYFQDITISTGDGRTIVPRLGSQRSTANSSSIVRNGEWFFPKQAQFTRRYIFKGQMSNAELDYRKKFGGLGFMIDGDRCWHNVKAFGPTKSLMGRYTNDYNWNGIVGRQGAVASMQSRRDRLHNALKNGQANPTVSLDSGPFGPFHPYFKTSQGAHGGEEIDHVKGYSLSVQEYGENMAVNGANNERQPWTIYRNDGDPKTAENFASENNDIIPFVYGSHDFAINAIPEFKYAGDFNEGSANREIEIWKPHDSAHQVRYNKRPQTLVYLGNDSMAKDDMKMSAELNILELHLFNHLPNGWATQWTLKEKIEYAQGNTRNGNIAGRDFAWKVESVCAYNTIADEEWRRDHIRWFKKVAEMIVLSQMPTGWVTRKTGSNQPVVDASFPQGIDVTQSFEAEFEDWAKMCLSMSTLKDVSDRHFRMMQRSILRSAKTFFKSIYDGNGFPWYVGVGLANGPTFRLSELDYFAGGNENSYGWFVMLFAHYAARELRQSKPEQWLEFATSYRIDSPSQEDRVNDLMRWGSTDPDFLPAAMPLIGEIQRGANRLP